MSDCYWLSDRMPSVALGRAAWTPDEVRHLNGCQSCQQEWELVQTTSRLGERLTKRLDASAGSQALLQRLDRSSRRRQRIWSIAGIAAAAAITALLWTGPEETVPEPVPMVGRLEIPLPELEELQPTELDSVLRTMDQPAPGASALEEPDLGELDSEELETVLDYWEG